MRRLVLLLASLASLASSCGGEPSVSPQAAVRSEVDSASFLPGRVYRFAFAWSSHSEGRGPAILPEQIRVTGGLELAGTLAIRAVGEGGLISVSIEGLERAELSVFGQNVLRESSVLLGKPAYVELSPDGALRRLFMDADAPPITRELLTAIVGRIDLRAAAAVEGTVTSSQGLARARYTRDGRVITRTLVGTERVDGDPGAGAGIPQVEGQGALVLATTGEVLELHNEDRLSIASDREASALQASTRFEAVRVSVAEEPPRPQPDLAAMLELDSWDPPDDAQARREMGRRFADGLTSFEASMVIRAAGNGLVPPRGFAVRAVGMLRGWPERAADMLEIFDATTDERAQGLVFDLLAGAGTPEAQRIMLQVLERDEVRRSPLHAQLVQRCGFVARPLPELGEYLLELESDTPPSASHRALLYPMGSLARRYSASDPVLAEAMLARVRGALDAAVDPQDTVAALAGLGNAGRAEDYGAVESRTHHEHAAVRGMAAVALRHHRTAAAQERLIAMLGDDDPYVARQAIGVIDEQSPPALAQRLALVGASGAYHPGIAYALADTMLSEAETKASVHEALVAMRARAHDPQTARHFERWVSEGRL